MGSTRIEDLPEDARPFERYQRYGIHALSDAELLALILRTGTKNLNCMELCRQVLESGGGNLSGIYGKSEKELRRVPGIGPVKAVQLVCIGEIAKRIARTRRNYDSPLDDAKKVSERYMEAMRHLKEEHVILLALDVKCRLIREIEISVGTVNQSVLRPREVFVQALKHEAVNIILLHNHPSGDPVPSREDLMITEKLVEVSKLVGIPLLDHIIIGDCCFTSLRENGEIDF